MLIWTLIKLHLNKQINSYSSITSSAKQNRFVRQLHPRGTQDTDCVNLYIFSNRLHTLLLQQGA